jgi:Fic family protein
MVAKTGSPHEMTVSHETLGLIAEIDEFKGKWAALRTLSPERLLALRHVATIESVGSSTRIEGARLADREIETLLSNVRRRSFKSRDEQEVAGYAAAMDLVFQAWEQLFLTENHVKQLHSVLLKHSAKDEHHRGQYKKTPNDVVAYDSRGSAIGVVFETASPFETPLKMEVLVRETRTALSEGKPHPLLAIATFALRFLAIHPFQDGNGRLSRILTTLLLLQAGYAHVPYSSLESVIEENKDLYYAALRRTQVSLKRKKAEWEPWITFFLRCLKQQKDRLEAKIERERILAPTLPELSIKILGLLKEHERLTARDLRRLTRANPNTLKVRLRELVGNGYISRHGRARGTWYTLAREQ